MKSLAKANLQLAQSHRTDPRTSLLSLLSLNRKLATANSSRVVVEPSKPPSNLDTTDNAEAENAEAVKASAESNETESEEDEPSSSDRRLLAAAAGLDEEVNTCLFDNCNLKSIDGYQFCYQHVNALSSRKLVRLRSKRKKARSQKPTATVAGAFLSSSDSLFLCTHQLSESGDRCKEFAFVSPFAQEPINTPSSSLCFKHLIEKRLGSASTQQIDDGYRLISDPVSGTDHSLSEQRVKLAQLAKRKKEAAGESSDDDDVLALLEAEEPLESDLLLLDSSDSMDETMKDVIKETRSKRKRFKAYQASQAHRRQSGNERDQEDDEAMARRACSMGAKDSSVDYDHLLGHAGVYTKREAVDVFKCKMSKLQLLYKRQLALLSDKIMLERKRYLTLKQKEEAEQKLTSVESRSRLGQLSKEEVESLRVERAARKYKSLSRIEAYLKEKYDPTQSSAHGNILENDSSIGRCIHSTEEDTAASSASSGGAGGKCGKRVVPLSKYCLEHILSDPGQILFCQCGPPLPPVVPRAGSSASTTAPAERKDLCKRPVIASMTPRCPLHLPYTLGLLPKAEVNKLQAYKPEDTACASTPLPNHLVKMAKERQENLELKTHLEQQLALEWEKHLLENQLIVRIKEEFIESNSTASSTDTAAAAASGVNLEEPEMTATTSRDANVLVDETTQSDRLDGEDEPRRFPHSNPYQMNASTIAEETNEGSSDVFTFSKISPKAVVSKDTDEDANDGIPDSPKALLNADDGDDSGSESDFSTSSASSTSSTDSSSSTSSVSSSSSTSSTTSSTSSASSTTSSSAANGQGQADSGLDAPSSVAKATPLDAMDTNDSQSMMSQSSSRPPPVAPPLVESSSSSSSSTNSNSSSAPMDDELTNERPASESVEPELKPTEMTIAPPETADVNTTNSAKSTYTTDEGTPRDSASKPNEEAPAVEAEPDAL